jgi:signal transduction histidine kinase
VGFGFTGMRERAEFSGGRLIICSTPGEGTVVLASWPLQS